MSDLTGRDFISTTVLSRDELDHVLERAAAYKAGEDRPDLSGRTLLMLFFNPSLRTRVSFEIAMNRMGGHAVVLNAGSETWELEHREGMPMLGSAVEHVKDAARVLSRYGDAIAVRAFAAGNDWALERQEPLVMGFQQHADIPVINMESALHHPCQGLADLMTMRETVGDRAGGSGGDGRRLRATLTWAHHPRALPVAVPHSFAAVCAQAGIDLTIAHPEGFELDRRVMDEIRWHAEQSGSDLNVSHDMDAAVEDVDVVCAKSWGGLRYFGRPDEEAAMRDSHRDWRVTEERMARTDDGVFLHCLPVRRGVVVDDAVLDGPACRVYDEAENRLWVQMALLGGILG